MKKKIFFFQFYKISEVLCVVTDYLVVYYHMVKDYIDEKYLLKRFLTNQWRQLYLITSAILEIPIQVLISNMGIFSRNLAEQIHLTAALLFLAIQ